MCGITERRFAELSMTKDRMYSTEEVAEILAVVTGETCACNINSTDAWLSAVCKYCEDGRGCPDPYKFDGEYLGCWKEYLRNYDMLTEYTRLGFERYWDLYNKYD